MNRVDESGNSWKDIKNWVKEKYNAVKNWYNENLSPSVKSFKKFSTVNDDVKAEMYIAAENMINANSGKSYTEKKHNKPILNYFIGSNSKYCANAYSELNGKLDNGLKTIIMDEYGVSMDIEGLTWNELNSQQQQMIADNYLAWDQGTIFWIGVFYGFSTTKDVAESAMNAYFGG